MSTRRTRLPETDEPRWGVELTRIELLRLREVLKVAGLPLTPSRAALLWGIQRANAPVSLAELSETFEAKGWARASVTRAVNELVGAGLDDDRRGACQVQVNLQGVVAREDAVGQLLVGHV